MIFSAILYFLPLILITNTVLSEFMDPNDKRLDNLYKNGMLEREDKDTDVYFKEYYVP